MNCMTCSCPINTASEGWAEWIGTGEDTDDDKRKCYGFRIVHHVMASPLRVDKTRGTGCYWPQEVMPPGHAPCDHHLDFFIDNPEMVENLFVFYDFGDEGDKVRALFAQAQADYAGQGRIEY